MNSAISRQLFLLDSFCQICFGIVNVGHSVSLVMIAPVFPTGASSLPRWHAMEGRVAYNMRLFFLYRSQEEHITPWNPKKPTVNGN